MMRCCIFILLAMMTLSAFAKCVSVGEVTKCARIPTQLNWTYGNLSNRSYSSDGLGWQLIYGNNLPIYGTASEWGGGMFEDVECRIVSPFFAEFTAPFEPSFMMSDYSAAQICANEIRITGVHGVTISVLPDDKCPAGFYTVPYDFSCGAGMVDSTDIPNCTVDVSGEYCVMPFNEPDIIGDCISARKITKCARFPDEGALSGGSGNGSVFVNGEIWSSTFSRYSDITMYGVAEITQGIENGCGPMGGVFCKVTKPFFATTVCHDYSGDEPAEYCANNAFMLHDYVALPDDNCPDGFFTVPSENSCADGYVMYKGIPKCDEDTTGVYCLIGDLPSAQCGAGLTVLRTSTGVSVPLWAEKQTMPALHIRYNGDVCYANLEPGQSSDTLNVRYNGSVYHVTR